FLRVVHEVGLGVVAGLLADDLDGVLVGADCAVGTEPEEHGFVDAFHRVLIRVVDFQAAARDILFDADHELVFRFGSLQVVQDRLGHSRVELLGTEAVAATHDNRVTLEGEFLLLHGFADGGAHVEVDRLAECARLLGEGLQREGAIKANLDHTDFLAFFDQIFNRILNNISAGTHDNDNALGIFGPDVIDQFVLATGQLAELVHLFLYDLFADRIVGVDGLAPLEVDIRILGGTAHDRLVRVEAAGLVFGNQFVVDHGAHFVKREFDNFLDLVGGSESVEIVQEGNSAAQGRGLGDQREVHDLLNVIRAEESPAGGAAGHDIRMVSEDGERLGGDSAGRDMENSGGQFACDLEH